MRTKLFFLSIISLCAFTYFSYTVAKERWQQIDFDTTVKLQDHISRKFDTLFSYFSLLGSVEVTLGICLIFMVVALLSKHWLAPLGWLMIIPASMGEVFGKLVLFHPGPPVLFHRSILPTDLPSFYIHTNFSYPSGHMTRTIFILTILFCLVVFLKKNSFSKSLMIFILFIIAFMMILTRVYLGEHWLSDTLGGALLGLGMGVFAAILILPRNMAKDAKVLPSI